MCVPVAEMRYKWIEQSALTVVGLSGQRDVVAVNLVGWHEEQSDTGYHEPRRYRLSREREREPQRNPHPHLQPQAPPPSAPPIRRVRNRWNVASSCNSTNLRQRKHGSCVRGDARTTFFLVGKGNEELEHIGHQLGDFFGRRFVVVRTCGVVVLHRLALNHHGFEKTLNTDA